MLSESKLEQLRRDANEARAFGMKEFNIEE
jgi:hypothetical protein